MDAAGRNPLGARDLRPISALRRHSPESQLQARSTRLDLDRTSRARGPFYYSDGLLVWAFLARVLCAGPADALTTSVTVPVVLSLSGLNGSFYTSEVTLTNRGAKDASVTLVYAAAFGGGSGSAGYLLPAGQQRIYGDTIGFLRALGVPIPTQGNVGGTLAITFAGVDSSADVAATVRTTTAGLRQNDKDRSNVALVNLGTPSDGDVRLRVTIFSGSTGAAAGVLETPVAPGGFFQYSEILGGVANGWVRVERIAGSAPWFAYGVVNDQANSDGSFVPPLRPETLAGRASLTLPVVVETSTFTSELVATNTGASEKTLHLAWVADGLTTFQSTARVDLTLGPGAQLVIPSFAQTLRERGVAGVPPAGPTLAGALFATAEGGDVSGIALGARTSAPGGGGRYGLFYTATPSGLALTSPAWLYGLQQNGENRTNLALVNTGEVDAGPDTFRIEIFNGDTGGLIVTVDGLAVPARGWVQYGSILSALAGATSNGYARVTRTSGANPFLTYAVVNDGGGPGQRSGDGAFLAPDRACVYTVAPVVDSVGTTGGAGAAISVAAADGCFWTSSSDTPFLSITSGASGAGSGTVTYSATGNDGAARSGTLTIAGRRVTVSQAGSGGCAYALSSTADSVESRAGSGSVSVATTSGCTWTASSHDSWITVTAGASGSGPGTVAYTYGANSGPARTGTLTIAGVTYTLAQAEPKGPNY